MDEPTAALADHEVEQLGSLVRRLTARGIGILYISHRLREIFDLSRRITVLKDGRRVTTLDTRETDAETVVRAMVGRSWAPTTRPGPARKSRARNGSRCAAAATPGSPAST